MYFFTSHFLLFQCAFIKTEFIKDFWFIFGQILQYWNRKRYLLFFMLAWLYQTLHTSRRMGFWILKWVLEYNKKLLISSRKILLLEYITLQWSFAKRGPLWEILSISFIDKIVWVVQIIVLNGIGCSKIVLRISEIFSIKKYFSVSYIFYL